MCCVQAYIVGYKVYIGMYNCIAVYICMHCFVGLLYSRVSVCNELYRYASVSKDCTQVLSPLVVFRGLHAGSINDMNDEPPASSWSLSILSAIVFF